MSDILLQVLHWAVPGGVGAALSWLLSRQVRQARDARSVHDAYKQMYEDVSGHLTELRQDYDKLFKVCTRLERALSRASVCRYWPQCPIRDELPELKARGAMRRGERRSSVGPHRIRDTGDGDAGGGGGQCEAGDSDSGDADPPQRCGVHEEAGSYAREPET